MFNSNKKKQLSKASEWRRWLRVQLIIKLLYATGLRLHELAQAKKGDLVTYIRDQHVQCWLSVLGKGKKPREVPLPYSIETLLKESLPKITGLAWSKYPQDGPLIPGLREPYLRNLTPKAIYVELKTAFKAAAHRLETTEPDSALILSQATTHCYAIRMARMRWTKTFR